MMRTRLLIWSLILLTGTVLILTFARVEARLLNAPPALLLPQAPGTWLRDLHNHLIGHLDPEGRLELRPGIVPELLPPTLSAAVTAANTPAGARLSIDLDLARLSLEALGGHRGSIVLIDAHTGDVLAAVSDPKTLEEGGTPAFEQRREPASISKLITTTASRRAGIFPEEELAHMTCRGMRQYDGQPLYCASVIGKLHGLYKPMAYSCNVAFADLGVQIGRRGMVEELRRYGFDRPSDGVFGWGRILAPEGDARQLADLAIGLEATDITPLHAALLAAVMANDGVMPEPRLIVSTGGELALGAQPRPLAEGKVVIRRSWVPQMLAAMEAVVEYGTARHVAPPGFPVAMKTGTASHPGVGFHVNYIGFGPLPEARVAFCVRITHQASSRKVHRVAREVTERFLASLDGIAGSRGWRPESPQKIADQTATGPGWSGPKSFS